MLNSTPVSIQKPRARFRAGQRTSIQPPKDAVAITRHKPVSPFPQPARNNIQKAARRRQNAEPSPGANPGL
jgi:hypothetical protein